MNCKCTADIYNMKAMAARPAAPKDTTSLAAAPVYVWTGLEVFLAGAAAQVEAA